MKGDMRVLPEEIYVLQRIGFCRGTVELLRVYNILFEPLFSLGGAC